MDRGERQIETSLEGIRRDHVARYEWARDQVCGTVLDIGAGIGYGTAILSGFDVASIEIDKDAIKHGNMHFGASYSQRDLNLDSCFWDIQPHGAAIAFEVIEHLKRPKTMLSRIPSQVLYASVPNEDHFPYLTGYRYHHRHYRPHEFRELLEVSGWHIVDELGQKNGFSDVENTTGRTIVVKAVRSRQYIKSRAPLGSIVTTWGNTHAHNNSRLGAFTR